MTNIPENGAAVNRPDVADRINGILADMPRRLDLPEDVRASFETLARAVEELADHVAHPQRLAVVDPQGRSRIILAADGPEPSITLQAADGKRRMALVLAEDGAPAIRLYSPAGQALATLAVTGYGVFYDDYVDVPEQDITAGLLLQSPDGAKVQALASASSRGLGGSAEVGAYSENLFAAMSANEVERAADVEVNCHAQGDHKHFRLRAKRGEDMAEATGG
jgi:hypothetical protein